MGTFISTNFDWSNKVSCSQKIKKLHLCYIFPNGLLCTINRNLIAKVNEPGCKIRSITGWVMRWTSSQFRGYYQSSVTHTQTKSEINFKRTSYVLDHLICIYFTRCNTSQLQNNTIMWQGSVNKSWKLRLIYFSRVHLLLPNSIQFITR